VGYPSDFTSLLRTMCRFGCVSAETDFDNNFDILVADPEPCPELRLRRVLEAHRVVACE
jgi:hypothetical protein